MAKIKDIHLIAFYVQKPRRGVQTQKAGWLDNPDNWQYDERIELTRGLSGKDRQYAGVILNLQTKSVVYNKFGKEKTFDDLFKYFLEAYPKYVIQVMAQLDMEYLEQFIPKEETPHETGTDNPIDFPKAKDETIQAE
jgi:hypothetical protein